MLERTRRENASESTSVPRTGRPRDEPAPSGVPAPGRPARARTGCAL